MSEAPTTNGEAAAKERVRAEHKQEMTRIETAHERDLAVMDAGALKRMPLPLRMIFDDRLRQKIERAATEMAEAGAFTPKHLINQPAACKVVLTKAIGWNLDPYAVAMSTYVIDGKIAFEGKLYRAIAEASGELLGAIHHEYYGDWTKLPRPSFEMVKEQRTSKYDGGRSYEVSIPKPRWEFWGQAEVGLGVKISATLAATDEEISLDFDLVDAYPRNATTWPTRPKLQLLNPAIRAFVNQVRPALLMGVHFRDAEPLPDDGMKDVTPEPEPPAAHTFVSQVVPANGGARDVTGPPQTPGEAIPPQRPAASPSFAEVRDCHGEVIKIAVGEVDGWIDSQVGFSSGDELDDLIEANLQDADLNRRILAAIEAKHPPEAAPKAAGTRTARLLGTWDDQLIYKMTTQRKAAILAAITANPDNANARMDDDMAAMFAEELRTAGYQEPSASPAPGGYEITGQGPVDAVSSDETPTGGLYTLNLPGGGSSEMTSVALVDNLEQRIDTAKVQNYRYPLVLMEANNATLAEIAHRHPLLAARCRALHAQLVQQQAEKSGP